MNIKELKGLSNPAMARVLRKALEKKNYKVFKGGRHDLNLIFIRNTEQLSSIGFNDLLVVVSYTKTGLVSQLETFKITTDPGLPARLKPVNSKGTGILLPQQVIGGLRKGKHKGYAALIQNKKFAVCRDNDKNNLIYDMVMYSIPELNHKFKINRIAKSTYKVISNNIEGIYEFAMGGFNCHRASKWKILNVIGLYSAGCQVHQDPYRYNKVFMKMIDEASLLYGSDFTFTLITDRDL